MIGIIDYGLGNVLAFANVFKRQNISFKIATTPDDVSSVDKIILPGVGAFDHAMKLLNESGLREPLEIQVKQHAVPVLGICVGMQILGTSSDEGQAPGLNWVPGRIRKFTTSPEKPLRLPHMGWNDVRPVQADKLFESLEEDGRFYFLHSFYFDCASAAHSLAVSDYPDAFSCAVRNDNIYGVQFHPEKSHHFGAQLLKNFAEL
jgi:glutamine amidotransferase